MNEHEEELFECTVIGNKNFHSVEVDEDTGERIRVIAEPGDTVHVTALQLERFSHRLVLPEVAKAVAKADKAVKKAKKAVAKAIAQRKRPATKKNADKADKATKVDDAEKAPAAKKQVAAKTEATKAEAKVTSTG